MRDVPNIFFSYFELDGSIGIHPSIELVELGQGKYTVASDFNQFNQRIEGTIIYIENGQIHNSTGPAVIQSNRVLQWKKYDMLHRVDGPAVIYPESADKLTDVCYYLDSIKYSEKAYNNILSSINSMSRIEKLIDPRWWVRDLAK